MNMPRLLLPAETGEKMRAQLESQGPPYQDQVETSRRQKTNEARREELVRLSNYEGVGAPQ